jgi:preprotein translocase subunit Sec63
MKTKKEKNSNSFSLGKKENSQNKQIYKTSYIFISVVYIIPFLFSEIQTTIKKNKQYSYNINKETTNSPFSSKKKTFF